MVVGKEARGPLWVDGQFTVRVRGPGPEPARIVRLRRPFALIGQIPGADIRIDHPSVEGRHALLLLDHRGLFGVDLLSRTGTRFAGEELASSWLGAGDILEIDGTRVEILQLRIDGSTVDPPLSDDDPLADDSDLVGLALEPLDAPGPPWMLGSSLAFVGRGDACVIRIEHATASQTHCALLRCPSNAYVIDLLGRRTMLNGRDVEGASTLADGDVLTVGQARFTVRIEPVHDRTLSRTHALAIRHESPARHHQEMMLAGILEAARDSTRSEVLDVLRRFQADTAMLLEAQIDRIEAMNREILLLRQEVQGRLGPPEEPAEPLRLDLTPPPDDPSDRSATWLLDRLNTLEAEGRSSWKNLLGRLGPGRSKPDFADHS